MPERDVFQGCHGQGKIREKQIFFKVMEKSGNCVSSQGISKFYLKVSEKSGNFTFVWPFGFGKRFLGSKGDFVQKNPAKMLISAGFITQGFALDGQ